MTHRERTLWDDLIDFGRQILDALDHLLHPEKHQRQPARVPIPVGDHPQQPSEHEDS